MILRPYQQNVVSAVHKALENHNDTLVVAATGAGKTIILSSIAGDIGGKQLILQHRHELVRQNMSKYQIINPDVSVGLWTAGIKSFASKTTFAMVQSLEKHTDEIPKLDLLIADEAHHCAAPTWKRIINAVKDKNPDVKILGFTATPTRADRKGLRSVFSNVAAEVSTKTLIGLGFLVPYRTFVVNVGDTIESLRNLKGQSDFGDQEDVAEILNTVPVNEEIIRNWHDKSEGRPTVVFASTVAHAQSVAKAFREAGISAECVHGEMPIQERKEILDRMAAGDVQVVTNAMVLTEGWDFPPVSCVILLRQCSSKSPMIQMVGRGLRTVNPEEYPGVIKKDCIILDFGASLLTHGTLEADSDLTDDVAAKEQEPLTKLCPQCRMELPIQTRVCPICGYLFVTKADDAQQTHIELTEIDLLSQSKWRYEDLWGNGCAMIASGFTAWAAIFSSDFENWYALGKVATDRRVRLVRLGSRIQALAAADDFLREHETENNAKKTKRWLDEAATQKQMETLAQFGYHGIVMTKYSASCHLNYNFNATQILRLIGAA